MKNNKLLSSALLISITGFTQNSFATNGYQLIGIGGYQKSLAGAVTANPGSAMTAITNPAGMARIGKRADFSMEMFSPDRYVDFTPLGGNKQDSAAEQYGVPALGWTAPVEDGSDIYFGGGIYGTSGMGADYGITSMAAPGAFGPNEMYFEGYSAIQFWQMAPTIAWNHNDKLTLGVSLNIDYQSVSLKQAIYADDGNDIVPEAGVDLTMVNIDLSRTAQAFGFGISLGALYDVNDQITVGASYKSKQNFSDLEYQLGYGDIIGNVGFGLNPGCGAADGQGRVVCPAGTYRLDLDYPSMLAVGIAYNPVKPVTLSLDIKQIKWSETLTTMDISGPGGMLLKMPAGWDDQIIIALGIEYDVSEKLRLRAGYNQADAPIDNNDAFNNLILPATSEKHIAVGADYRLGKNWDLGFHLSKASSHELTDSTYGAKIGLEITTVGINLGYRF